MGLIIYVMSQFEKAKKWIETREKDLAKSLLKYKLSKEGIEEIDEKSLNSGADRVVSEANRLVKKRGREIISDISKGIGKFMNKVKK